MSEGKKHMGIDERSYIESSLNAALKFSFIADNLGLSKSTISREVKRNRTVKDRWRSGRHSKHKDNNNITCANLWKCNVRNLCKKGCVNQCSDCLEADCIKLCPSYEPNQCPRLEQSPYVCNGCINSLTWNGCTFERWFYQGKDAQAKSDSRQTLARSGINVTADQLQEMVEIIGPLLEKGQSLEHIWSTHPNTFPISPRTFYTYIDSGQLDICNIDLPKKSHYKSRKIKDAEPTLNPIYIGRTYEDFLRLSPQMQAFAVEMDCVESSRGSSKTILTILFRSMNYQLMSLLMEHTREQVQRALDKIERRIGLEAFRRYLGIMLTDHGHEFNNFSALESSCTVVGELRCRIYYCDPNCPGQKGACEKNHVELRKILPKRTNFQFLDDDLLALAASHVNSYTRPILKGRAPIDLAYETLPEGLITGLGMEKIDPEKITLTPELLTKNSSENSKPTDRR